MLTGRTILVTGAARGLGRAIAGACAEQGARLVLADIDSAGVQAAASELGARAVTVDLGDPASINALAEDIAAHEGELHGLCNNGAVATNVGGMAFEDIEIDLWDRVHRVNVRGTWLMTRACSAMLRASGSGRVVNVASDTAIWGAPRLLAYTASKGAVMAMTRSLAREMGPDRVGVTCIAPGILTTESTEYVPAARHALYGDGRAVPGPQSAEEVTGTVAFLLSDAALTLTGQTLPVNNGYVFVT
ncbi:SDR family oxidoreductase [Pararhodobacter aggregans]|uniref:Short-chain dehydrogenase n=1 Tax=Pararhodobacter aggregans TaxID=404875 RepID=A0A2T7UM93_9RHOB|nr:SDR family oxidoreductase [Pararhodobacter aggregans]PTW99931.1 NAD(P)-dependent dehydrogenase (short-subunit alcohol dehydrogenase family) [Pararhodobacter aggregans]PVE45822.1 short-chain dehydrogenase [Pararhodobacter aggregans]